MQQPDFSRLSPPRCDRITIPATLPAMHSRTRVILMLLLFALLPVAAIWIPAHFATQDGPAHLYNASILGEDLRGHGVYSTAYRVERRFMPNVAGHWILAALMNAVEPLVADRIMITLTSIGLALSTLLLRFTVARSISVPLVALAVTLSLNRLWLLGFYNFLLGAIVFALTLAYWWKRRHSLNVGDSVALAGLLIMNYLCHPVSCGAVILGVLTLAGLTPTKRRMRTILLTILAFLPLLPFLIAYQRMLLSHGSVAPDYRQQTMTDWLQRLHRIKFLSLSSTSNLPFTEIRSSLAFLIAPALLVVVGILVLMWKEKTTPEIWREERRPWMVLAIVLFVAAVFGPPTLGAAHGDFLRERLFALATIAGFPLLPATSPSRKSRIASILFFGAFTLQTAFVWDYARFSSHRISPLIATAHTLDTNRSILGYVVKSESKFRASPDLHALTLLGVGNGNVVWNNYEADLYYFPVKFRQPLSPCDETTMRPLHFVNVEGLSARRTIEARAFLCVARKNRSRLNTLVVEGVGAKLDPWLTDWRPRNGANGVRVYE